MIIGLSGYARTGKNEVGDILEGEGFIQLSWATALREMLVALNPIVDPGDNLRLEQIIQVYGWDKAKVMYPEIRMLQQRMGTEAGRRVLGMNIWVDTLMDRIDVFPSDDERDFVITDTRFPNEANACDYVWRIRRPGIDAVNAHESERALDSWDFDLVIDNDGTLDDLRAKVLHALA